ncbi:MAG: hypothetical protein V1888_00425 [archaeon]
MEKIKLIGSKFLEIKAERNLDFTGKLKLKTNINIISIEKVEKSKDTLKIIYNFKVNYEDLGEIYIKGILFLISDINTIKNIIKNKENKEYNNEEYILITNLIIQKASLKALELEEELNLPIHIKLPSISFKK